MKKSINLKSKKLAKKTAKFFRFENQIFPLTSTVEPIKTQNKPNLWIKRSEPTYNVLLFRLL